MKKTLIQFFTLEYHVEFALHQGQDKVQGLFYKFLLFFIFNFIFIYFIK